MIEWKNNNHKYENNCNKCCMYCEDSIYEKCEYKCILADKENIKFDCESCRHYE